MRPLFAHERLLVEALLQCAGMNPASERFSVEEMDDGGMGSLTFAPPGRTLGGAVAECEFEDADGVLVLVVLNVDPAGQLLELDMWKVDFAPLGRWPDRNQLTNMTSRRAGNSAESV